MKSRTTEPENNLKALAGDRNASAGFDAAATADCRKAIGLSIFFLSGCCGMVRKVTVKSSGTVEIAPGANTQKQASGCRTASAGPKRPLIYGKHKGGHR